MAKTVTSTELQRNTRDIIDYARVRGDTIIVETYGKPMVVILSYDEYQDYASYRERHKKPRSEGVAETLSIGG
jgi:prevent-host-death family protein